MRQVIICLLVVIIFPFSVSAEKEFSVGLDVTYRFDKDGISQVEQIVTITNLTQYMYAENYEMNLSGDTPKNIKAWDDGGQMKIDEIFESGQTKIKVNFNNPVAGRDRKYQFHLSYLGRPAIHNGQVWEVSFPRLSNADEIDSYRLSVIIPKSFGRLAFSSPNPESNNGEIMVITHNQGAQYGVVAAFGDFQTYEFNLSYTIDKSQTISLPSDSGYQRIFYDNIEPMPDNITIDIDGNWRAFYEVKNKEKKSIRVSGRANILSESSQFIPSVGYHDLTKYTKPTTYWPSDNETFSSLAKTYKTPQDIYEFVIKTLKYDKSKKPIRSGALEALNKPDSALCTEFSDLFITMSRAAGIPARELNGFAYTSNPELRPLSLSGIDVLHAWPQYWDFAKSTWISVDPTWEVTTKGIDYFSKMDFNHFAFVSHGVSDTEPRSAGFYKMPGDETKSVDVKFGEFKDYPAKPLELKVEWPWQIWAPLGASAKLIIMNPNSYALYRTSVRINHVEFSAVDVLPPFSTHKIDYQINPNWNLNFDTRKLEFEAGVSKLTYNIKVSSYFVWHATVAIFSSFILILLGFIASRIWSLHLQRQTV
ncbi:transglutaminase family protein [Candidatus Amesbacteria bacterium]|nr:transglutaminase family protein [Candidatus Amesbacteria bacterium]